jgi:hypothetical protein
LPEPRTTCDRDYQQGSNQTTTKTYPRFAA